MTPKPSDDPALKVMRAVRALEEVAGVRNDKAFRNGPAVKPPSAKKKARVVARESRKRNRGR